MSDFANYFSARVLAVIVLYKLSPGESVAFNTLQASILSQQYKSENIKVLLYDNTPGGQDIGALPANVQFKADFENGGLAKAYNYALEIAQDENFGWLLTLDQDTSLPINFVNSLFRTADFVAPLNSVAAIVPCVSDCGRVMSPGVPRIYQSLTKHFPEGFIGISLKETIAINSASTLRVDAIKSIGGYDSRFALWHSDIVMFHRIYCNHFKVFVAGNIYVDHEMSFLDLQNRSTPNKYEDMLRAEEAFYDEYVKGIGHLALVLRIVYRMAYTLWKTKANASYFWINLRFLCAGLFYSRKHRVKRWEQAIATKRRNS